VRTLALPSYETFCDVPMKKHIFCVELNDETVVEIYGWVASLFK
jgi:hypothetical protein